MVHEFDQNNRLENKLGLDGHNTKDTRVQTQLGSEISWDVKMTNTSPREVFWSIGHEFDKNSRLENKRGLSGPENHRYGRSKPAEVLKFIGI